MKKASKKKITMENLAGMVQRGFSETSNEIRALKGDMTIFKLDMVTLKGDVGELKEDVSILKNDIASLKENFHKVLDSLDKVAKQYADYLEERKLRDVEIQRLKRWVEQIAQKVGVELVD